MIASPTNSILDFVLVLSNPNSPDRTKNEDKGKVIGKAGIWTTNPTPEIGFMLNRSFWGKGYMKEAMEVLVPVFWERGMERVVADVDPRNQGSIGILKAFGWRETGRDERTGEVGGVWYNSVYFALERPKILPQAEK